MPNNSYSTRTSVSNTPEETSQMGRIQQGNFAMQRALEKTRVNNRNLAKWGSSSLILASGLAAECVIFVTQQTSFNSATLGGVSALFFVNLGALAYSGKKLFKTVKDRVDIIRSKANYRQVSAVLEESTPEQTPLQPQPIEPLSTTLESVSILINEQRDRPASSLVSEAASSPKLNPDQTTQNLPRTSVTTEEQQDLPTSSLVSEAASSPKLNPDQATQNSPRTTLLPKTAQEILPASHSAEI